MVEIDNGNGSDASEAPEKSDPEAEKTAGSASDPEAEKTAGSVAERPATEVEKHRAELDKLDLEERVKRLEDQARGAQT